MEDFWDIGAGPIRDVGKVTFIPNNATGSNVPSRIVDKGTRDSRFNRGKPVPFVVWDKVSKAMGPCEISNPIRNDDAAQRDKSWNPGDYVPSYRLQLADSSQSDVLGKAGWIMGKWALEIRRDLIPRPRIPGPTPPGRPDDLQLEPGRRYMMRITITDGGTTDNYQVSYHGQTVAHIDTWCHFFENGMMYNGVPVKDNITNEKGCIKGSVMQWRNGVTARAVLYDIPALLGVDAVDPNRPITRADLEAWERKSGVKIGNMGPPYIAICSRLPSMKKAGWSASSPRCCTTSGTDRSATSSSA